MAINIKNLEARIQKKAASVTSKTPTAELGDIIEAANLATGGLAQYDSAGLLPTASSTQNIKMAYLKKDNSVRFNSGSAWNKMAPNAAVGGAVSTGPTGPSNPNQGTVNAYVAGGNPTTPGADAKDLDRFPFASDGDATDIGDLSFVATDAVGGGSNTDGYSMGGILTPIPNGVIQKYPYASDTVTTPTDTGESFYNALYRHGNKEMLGNREYIYIAGGRNPSAVLNNIWKFAPGSEDTTTDVGDLTTTQQHLGSASSPTHGYIAGGSVTAGGNPTRSNVIQKWPWATDENATDIADLTATYYGNVGASSETHGYSISGLRAGNNTANNIEKYTFASDANATDVGDSTVNIRYSCGASGDTHGYSMGGQNPPGSTPSNVIQKFPFATDENATDVGDLHAVFVRGAGSQSRV